MKKRLVSLLLMTVMVVTALTGCGVAKNSTDSTTAAKTYKVAMICDSSISDGGWGAACYNAMVTAGKANGFETQYTDSITSANFASSMRAYCDLGFNLIFAPGNQYTDAVKQVAADYPKVNFALLNGTVQTANIASILPDAKQIGYMAGALAGLTTKTNKIGFIGGMELDTTKAKLACYEAAAKIANPSVVAFSAYAGSFSDTAKGKEIANSMITNNNVDVFFGDASAVDSGAREVLSTLKDKYDIAQPSDLLATQKSDVVVGSVVTDNATMVGLCMKDVKEGTYGNKTVYGNLANGALSVGTFGTAISADVKTKYLEIVEKIKAGTFIQ